MAFSLFFSAVHSHGLKSRCVVPSTLFHSMLTILKATHFYARRATLNSGQLTYLTFLAILFQHSLTHVHMR